jgi:hypothetical protein
MIATLRLMVVPFVPAVEKLVKAEHRARSASRGGRPQRLDRGRGERSRTSLLPARSVNLPKVEPPIAALSLPGPLEKTISRTARVAAETRMSWAP